MTKERAREVLKPWANNETELGLAIMTLLRENAKLAQRNLELNGLIKRRVKNHGWKESST